MWQSRVEIEHFKRITAFVALYHSTSVKGGAHMHGVDVSTICGSTPHV